MIKSKSRDSLYETVKASEITGKIESESLSLLETVNSERERAAELYEKITDGQMDQNDRAQLTLRIDSLNRAAANMRQSYISTLSMADELSGRWEDVEKSRRKRRLIPAPPSNSSVDLTEEKLSHFARGLNIYKLLLILFSGSFIGVVIEMLWCLVRNGYIESRAGLVWGPFNLLYGIGGVALSLALYSLRNHRRWLSFVGGMVIGSAVEYACSWAQEAVFGSRSWDYSDMPFNLNGRICLLYAVFWGALGVLWIKNLYPRLAYLILKIPEKAGKAATVAVTMFLLINSVVTCAAVYRWSERKDGIPPSNTLECVIDSRFDDARMRRIFANMDFGDTESEVNKK